MTLNDLVKCSMTRSIVFQRLCSSAYGALQICLWLWLWLHSLSVAAELLVCQVAEPVMYKNLHRSLSLIICYVLMFFVI